MACVRTIGNRRRRGAWTRWLCAAAVAIGACLLGAGCASGPLAGQRVSVYAPNVPADDRMPWSQGGQTIADAGTRAPASSAEESTNEAEPMAGAGEATDVGNESETSSPVTAIAETAPSPSGALRRDDRLSISLRGIPQPQELSDIIDSDGSVNLPFIGMVKLEGLTSAEAERAIEQAYVRGGIFRSVNVSILSQQDSYYVRGEVARPGKYPLTGDTTLVMAITAAGGYTDYAKPSRIKVIRGEDVFVLNASSMEVRDMKDFLIQDNDVIVVPRRIVW